MKHVSKILMLMLVGVLVGMTSCQGSKLEIAVDTVNSTCPIKLDESSEITSLTYEDNVVTMTFTVDESVLDLDLLKGSIEELKNEIALQFSESNEGMKEMLNLITEDNAKIKFVYKGKSTGKTVECELTTAEIKDVLDKKAKSLEKLEANLKTANESLPQEFENGLTLAKVVIKGDFVVYEYKVNEDLLDMASLESNQEAMKNDAVATLAADNQQMKDFVKSCIDANKGTAYYYTGSTSGKQIKIEILVEEMQAL